MSDLIDIPAGDDENLSELVKKHEEIILHHREMIQQHIQAIIEHSQIIREIKEKMTFTTLKIKILDVPKLAKTVNIVADTAKKRKKY